MQWFTNWIDATVTGVSMSDGSHDKMLCPVCSPFVERQAAEAKGGKNM
tara:strand:+ start:812 stop:955 length:144 start_codon:yes stop_codon:yes gene_type:complete